MAARLSLAPQNLAIFTNGGFLPFPCYVRYTNATVLGPASKFNNAISEILPDINLVEDWKTVVPEWQIKSLKSEFRKFEAILLAELQTADLFHVRSKGGFDTRCLTDAGERIFPNDLDNKVPSAVTDVKAAAKCIAFELPTAAAFHLHRANEAVLRVYFDTVAGAENRPKSGNLGEYLNKMINLQVGDAHVIAVLKSLKDLHRNPVLHPENNIGSVDEALSLCAAIRASIGYMLDRIPQAQLPVVTDDQLKLGIGG